ncbi:MAG: hypothetical protein Q4F61_02695 [Candidatus Saccharibacteria bacterium]|nr:hypothetical protein [Candidatus Saccharibacteria bacterium]
MNKDVIYIEPEDDITDIITKIENAKQKIVALVPPKKAGVFRSVVNIKLITKAGATAKKTIVLVTTDPSIMKLAAATKLPVTKDLQSAPAVPDVDAEIETETKEKVKDKDVEDEGDDETDDDSEPEEKETEEEEKESKASDEQKKKKAEKKEHKNKLLGWVTNHKKVMIFSGLGVIVLILLLVWAFVIAPAVTVTVGIRTATNNFSENVTFTTKLEEEDSKEGKFYLAEKKIESAEEVEFEATGKKNIGEKASGNVVVFTYFPFNIAGSTVVSAGTKFTISGLSFTATENVNLVYTGNRKEGCDNKNNSAELADEGCKVSARVPVVADAPGESYNIQKSASGWTSSKVGIAVYSDESMSGGTDKEITIVSQADIDKAKSELATSNESENKEKLYSEVGDTMMPIDSSFTQTTSEAASTPAVGEEVKDGEKAKLKVTTTASILLVDKTKIEEFISEKAKLREDQKIYEMRSPFIENFTKTDDGYTGKLKTSYAAGPKITENDVIEIIKGKGLGEAQHDIHDIDGISDVKIDKSYPWVTSIPNNVNKITIILEVKE